MLDVLVCTTGIIIYSFCKGTHKFVFCVSSFFPFLVNGS